jgi:magnesium chelatase family protein
MGRTLGLASVETSVVVGVEARPIHVEVCTSRGPSFFQLVGLAETAVREARVRVTSALGGLDVLVDEHAVTVNLAPADLRKSGASLDVAIAVALLGGLDASSLEGVFLLGELALDGSLRPVRGVLPALLDARRRGLRSAIVPIQNAREAGLVGGIDVFGAARLADVVAHLAGDRPLTRVVSTSVAPLEDHGRDDLDQVRGQGPARRALEVAAAGGHNLLMIGPPGSGKTLLARLLPTILPPLEPSELIEATVIHSVAGLVDPELGAIRTRPFRAPHHSVSDAGLVGGGELPRPGEVSLAHHGVLFLDELAEFRRSTLEALRQPLEDGFVRISRARSRAAFPARPLLVAAVNPCPCGYRGHPTRACQCSNKLQQRYLSRLSGPLLDRIDVHVSVPPVDIAALAGDFRAESSAVVRARVCAARAIQRERFRRGLVSQPLNAALSPSELDAVAPLDAKGRRRLTAAAKRLGLSARAYVRIRRVARTVADLEGDSDVCPRHIDEAVDGRMLDRE